jgi:hypothetical protein
VSYTIEDNGPLDLDPDMGEVADPVGLAIAELTSPDTGIAPDSNTRLATLLSALALTVSLFYSSSKAATRFWG